MTEASLGPSSFIVLGLLSLYGAGTSYELKRWADESVGYFWTFPRSQLYAEPQRLVTLGLLTEQQEESGRRKRTFKITQAGQEALKAWLGRPAGVPELRDLGLLKLFFIDCANVEALPHLAAEQLALHQARLTEYEKLQEANHHLEGSSEATTLRMGFLYERASIAFWSEVQASSPQASSPQASSPQASSTIQAD